MMLWCRTQQMEDAMDTDELDSLLLAEEAQEASPSLFGTPPGTGPLSGSPSHTAAGEQSAAKPKADKKAAKGKVQI